MTNKEAIKMLKTICGDCRLFPKCAYKKSECFTAIDMAIKALEGKDNVPDTNVGDTIYRQDAIEALGEEPPVWYDGIDEISEQEQWRRDRAAIEAVPSAQPEIIRCKECKWFGEEGCAILIVDDSDKPTENDYCTFAERREE